MPIAKKTLQSHAPELFPAEQEEERVYVWNQAAWISILTVPLRDRVTLGKNNPLSASEDSGL